MNRNLAFLAAALALCPSLDGSACIDPQRGGAPHALADTSAAAAAAPPWVGPAHSGSWYTTTRSGEGFVLEILDRGTALLFWFTYPPQGSSATQAWIVAQDGRIDGDRIRFDNAFTTRGPRFGAQFDPAAIQVVPWGTLEFHFTGCNTGEVTYSGPSGWGSGTREIVRLTALAELECAGKRRLGVAGARSLDGLRARSGSWFDPAHNGEGWQVEELPDSRNLVYWYTYDERGEQMWTTGVSEAGGDRFAVAQVTRPVGTNFGSAFDAANVKAQGWGSLQFDYSGCDAATVSYASTIPVFGSGTLAPIRLTRLAGAPCVAQKPVVPSAGTWSTGATMPSAQSEVATATAGSRTCIAGGYVAQRDFQCYDADHDTWTTLPPLPSGTDHAEAFVFDGDNYVVGGNRNVTDGPTVSGWRYRFAESRWEDVPQLPDVAQGGATLLDGFAYMGGISGAIFQFNPRTGAKRQIDADGRAFRDHSQLVAFQGELWLIGGRDQHGVAHALVSIFDPASETWRAGPTMIRRRAGFAAVASDSVLFVAGGELLDPPQSVIRGAEAIAAGDAGWTELPPLIHAVHGVGGAIHGNAFMAIGGSGVAGVAVNRGEIQIYKFGP